MTPEIIGVAGLGILLGLLILGVPIGFALGLVGIVGAAILMSPEAALVKAGVTAFHVISSYELGVLPMFLLMAHIAFATGSSRDFFNVAARFVGHRRGGLAVAAVGGCAGFGAVSGSSLATVTTIGLVAMPEMRKYDYAPSLVTGSVAAGGTLGSMIPPSGMMIILGILTQQSIGTLFVAGIIPGLSQAVLYAIAIVIVCAIWRRLGPASPVASWRQRWQALFNSFDMMLLILLVIGGLLAGWFTPTESGAIGAAGATLIGIVRKKLTPKGFGDALAQTLRTTGMLFAIIVGAFIFSTFMAVSRVPMEISELLVNSQATPLQFMIGYLLILLVLGTFLDGVAIMTLTVPIFFPIVLQMDINPIWYGILTIRVLEIALITPPLGMNVYVIKGIAPDIPLYTIFRGITPFLLADLLHVGILLAIPSLVIWLTGYM
jgi:C4-dicarboxylate transporter DctM subunit